MTKWQKEPPTYRQWKDVNNHGVWWIKFLLAPERIELNEETGEEVSWHEVWFTDVVSITMSSTDSFKHIMQEATGEDPDYSGIRLHAAGGIGGRFDLDDATRTKDMYWQPAAAPVDDVKDQRPQFLVKAHVIMEPAVLKEKALLHHIQQSISNIDGVNYIGVRIGIITVEADVDILDRIRNMLGVKSVELDSSQDAI